MEPNASAYLQQNKTPQAVEQGERKRLAGRERGAGYVGEESDEPFGDDDADVISDLFEIGEQLRTVKSVRHTRRRGAKSTSCISGG